jgi:hypothetical protein
MSDTESDEDLQKAIALSLMSPQPKLNKIIVISDGESEDDDLDRFPPLFFSLSLF